MHYKGDDMDLRVPHARLSREGYGTAEYDPAFNNGRWRVASGSSAAGTEPLWVDEVVLACCNTAFDMALAHGATEVALEHLVHALTRVEAASRVLEARGVREGQLRRESAALMASDVATGSSADRLSPRRSADVEDVLRRASEIGGRRGVAASVDDLLWVLLNYGRDVPVIQLLRRLTPDWQRLDWGRGRELSVGVALTEAPRYVPQPELPRYIPLPVEPTRVVQVAGIEALAQRLALIEDSMRLVHAELSADRKALAELVRDVQRDIVSSRGDAAALRNDLGQRLDALERVTQARGDGGRLAERMQQLEKAVHSGLGEGARNWAALGQRLQAFEGTLHALSESGAIAPLMERLEKVEALLELRAGDFTHSVEGVAGRLAALERLAEAGAGERARNWNNLSERLGMLETQLASRPDLTGEAGALAERVAGLEHAVRAGFGDGLRQASGLLERIAGVESRLSQLQFDPGEGVLIVDERITEMEQRLVRLLDEQAQSSRNTTERLAAIEQIAANAPEIPTSDIGALAAPLMERMTGLETFNAKRSEQLQSMLGELAQRLTVLETSMRASANASTEALSVRDREIGEMHDALVRLGENQHTLASAISDWRNETNDRFALVTAQVEKLLSDDPDFVAEPARPADASESLDARSATLKNGLHSAAEDETTAPATPGRGFKWWLFGTDSVSRATRESDLKWERMRQNIQEERDRRREQI